MSSQKPKDDRSVGFTGSLFVRLLVYIHKYRHKPTISILGLLVFDYVISKDISFSFFTTFILLFDCVVFNMDMNLLAALYFCLELFLVNIMLV